MYVVTTLVQEGSTSRWAAVCHVLSDMTSHVIPHVAVRCGQTRPLAYITFTCNATRTVLAETEELQVHVSPVLSMHVPLCIPGQVSVSFLASPLPSFPPYLSVRHLDLGTKGWRAEESAAYQLAGVRWTLPLSGLDIVNKTMGSPHSNDTLFSPPSVYSLNTMPSC